MVGLLAYWLAEHGMEGEFSAAALCKSTHFLLNAVSAGNCHIGILLSMGIFTACDWGAGFLSGELEQIGSGTVPYLYMKPVLIRFDAI